MTMQDVVIVSAARTAVGKYNGALRQYETSDLGGFAIREAIARAGIDPQLVDEAVMGCECCAAENAYMARMAAIKAGMPVSSSALTVDRLCASGLQAIVTSAMEIAGGFADICVAGGAESMTNIPFYLRKARFGYGAGHAQLEDGLITTNTDPFSKEPMGVTAENIAEKYHITRQEQDEYALMSQQRAKHALESGAFQEQIFPVTVSCGKNETRIFNIDEHPRPTTTLEKLAALRPAFRENGTVTPGNSSGVNDGAAAMVLMSAARAAQLGCKPMARIVTSAVAGVEPELMGTGPIPAVRKLLAKADLRIQDIGVIELNEAFAAQAIACIRELELPVERTNVNGSGISLGHPVGATGCIISVKLLYEMRRRHQRYGLATLCIGGGQGMAVLYELL